MKDTVLEQKVPDVLVAHCGAYVPVEEAMK
jgi:hypothetical protein